MEYIFLQTLWSTKREFGIMINANGVHTRKFENLVNQELSLFKKDAIEVKWMVIDNWKPYRKDQQGISKYIQQEFPHVHMSY